MNLPLQSLSAGVPGAACKLAATVLLVCAGTMPLRAEDAPQAVQRGRAALVKGDLPAAVEAFTQAIRLDPKLLDAYLSRGWAYAALEQYDKARADYTEAIRLDPKNAGAWCNRGDVMSRQGDLQAAVRDLTEALRLDAKLLPAYVARGFVYSEQGAFDKAVADYSEAIRLNPEAPHLRVDRATCYAGLKKYAEAIADLDVAIRAEPKVPRFYGARGAAQLHLGNFRQGSADLRAAIELNPTDAGAKYQPSSGKELAPESLGHGRQQVLRMLRDRPAMARFGAETALLEAWAARKFAGEDFGEPFDWDPTPPRDSDAENVPPASGRRGLVRLEPVHQLGPQQGTPRSFEELWAGAVFELHNITYARQFRELHQQAAAGKLTKQQFVAGIWKYEYLAAQRTRAFYVHVFLPFAEKKKLATDPAFWFAAWWEEADDTLAGFTDKSSYPWRPYSRQYDWFAVRRLYHERQYQPALKLLEQMLTEKVYHDTADVHLWIGRCHLETDRPALAVEALGRAIQLAPQNAQAYQLRGMAYQELGQKAQAAADFARAKQLAPGGK